MKQDELVMKKDECEMINAKDALVRILQVAAHECYNMDEVRKSLDENESMMVYILETKYDRFDKDSSIEMQMMQYMEENGKFKKDSIMKRILKAFITYNSDAPEQYCVPSDEYVLKF